MSEVLEFVAALFLLVIVSTIGVVVLLRWPILIGLVVYIALKS